MFIRIKDFLRLVFNFAYGGGNCLVCGKETVLGQVCKDCRNNYLFKLCLPQETEKRCAVCGKLLLSESEICMSCRKEKIIESCDRVISIVPYRLWGKTLMFHWKMLEKRGISSLIAEMCHKAIDSRFEKGAVIVPVPPRPGKIWKKGWDQIDEVCSFLEFKYGYRVMKLLRRKNSVQQKKLDRQHRLENSEERYVLSKKGLKLKRENLPKRVIILDDVMTTGITVESCARVLKSKGIEKVYALTVFIVD